MTVSPEEPLFRMSIVALPANVAIARQAITGVCEALDADPRATEDVRLAVTEACTNAVIHAYGDDAPGGTVEVVATRPRNDGLLIVNVRDEGRGMGRLTGVGGLGLGLPLITAVTETVAIRTGPTGLGTELVMAFRLDAR